MAIFHGIIKVIEKINEYFIKAVMWFVLFLIVTLVYEVFMRYAVGSPTLWSYDVTYFSASLFLALGMAYTLKEGGHVNIDILIERMSVRTRAIVLAFFYLLLFFPLWYLIMDAFLPNVLASWASGERARVGSWMPIIYPFKTWLFVGVLLLTLQGVAEFLKLIYMAITNEDTYAEKSALEKIQEEVEETESLVTEQIEGDREEPKEGGEE